MAGKHQIAVTEIASKEKGVDISIADFMRYAEEYGYIDFTDDDQIPNLRAVKYLNGLIGAPAVVIPLTTSSPSLYTLSAPELALVNAIGRTPNFEAVTDSGQGNWSDIYPIYTPYNSPGSYTQIQVVLHDNGGVAAEDTLVQFS